MNVMIGGLNKIEFDKAVSSEKNVELFRNIDQRINGIRRFSTLAMGPRPQAQGSLPERLFDSLASFKSHTAQVSMHLGREWRDKLFSQLDTLLDEKEWEPNDLPPTLQSFSTLLRILLKLMPEKKPAIAATMDGILIAGWAEGRNRLTIHCLPNDNLLWFVTRDFGEGDPLKGGGTASLNRLLSVIGPYEPGIWFNRA